ncbi:hypothetical protein BD309DRAFT_971170 [Dichomitus squalens]|nr:hypothetical protein BD309DRAFT_971170 [Dichomitus squalens]
MSRLDQTIGAIGAEVVRRRHHSPYIGETLHIIAVSCYSVPWPQRVWLVIRLRLSSGREGIC